MSLDDSVSLMYGLLTAAVIEIPRRLAPVGRLTHLIPLFLAWTLVLLGISYFGLTLAGYRLNSTRGDSMDPTIAAGNLILLRPTLPELVRVGDIIKFPDPSGEFPFIVHRVLAVVNGGEHITAITKGDNNRVPDPIHLTLDKSVSRVVVVMPDLVSRGSLILAWGLLAICALLGQWLGLQRRLRRNPAGPRIELRLTTR